MRLAAGIYFLVAVILFSSSRSLYCVLNKLLFSYCCVLIGLSARLFYDSIFKDEKIKNEELKGKQVFDHTIAYIFFGISSVALVNITYLASYSAFQDMDYLFFYWISIPLFFTFGLVISELRKMYFPLEGEKKNK